MIRPSTLVRATLSLMYFTLLGSNNAAAQQSDVITVESRVPEWVDSIELESEFAGLLQARRRSQLSFERVGRLEQVHVQRGDTVEAGQVLAELNTEIIQSQIKKMQADHRSATAKLEEALAGPRAETIAAAQAALREQQALYDNAKLAYDRRKKLQASRLISMEELERALVSVTQFKETTEAAGQRLAELEQGTRVEQIEAQKAVVAAIAAAIDTLHVELMHSQIRSPFAGTVSERMLDEGAIVAPSQAVVTVIETSDMEAHIGVPIDVAMHVNRGDVVEIRVRDQKLSGNVRSVVNDVDRDSRTQQLIVKLNLDASAGVVSGENARLALTRTQKVDGFWIPVAALVRGPRGMWECYLVASVDSDGIGEVGKASLEILKTQGEQAFVRGTMDRPSRVIVSATHRITLGQRVRVAVEPSVRGALEEAAP